MNTQHIFKQFIQNHLLKSILLPDDTRYWQLSSTQITDLKLMMDEQFGRTTHPDFPREVHIWDRGPVLYEGLFGPGIVFCNLEAADSFLPKIRSHGFSEDEWFEFFALDREDVKYILSELDYSMISRPFIEDAQPVIALEKPYGYLIEGPNLWFPSEEYLRRYDKFIMEVESWL